ncbi:YifB family Mg chelatase-like AAA ATPase [Campylobacter canadensis]|uniref:YifB family Mg chelatase-like AAA ATPase n=1 Tax=Campylobacter canadensis TaxID=449520 RepID=A0ABS7WSR2_9BACT|nr:YifB family Mg chelatase-like AAA ATPase [Campylobacter canadensis]MBZ7987803.1 YifB family Mg chelatase-like AAA ATPase [Campylobacter canadensis]MBZ7995319.1 YifB family Mg chelatase-like AAA ATPase [Campylobacter canadensis]MBZ7997019.1 YifB family Mg chelatase-like AAA ATPase [Campylobacter canadensis]MBZ7998924.1 YifB family Mg chelatase-like AAA ATPase [Campylobacter canadensis]MBZ8000663.1 YifB family Mg chelatase-like AAA ATPase [Campylobacter canadensis]
MNKLNCAIYQNELLLIEIEAKLINSLPQIKIAGLADSSIKESIDRISAAFCNIENYKMPPKKIIINLSPSDVPKSGSYFDLAIALLIYFANIEEESEFFVFGELGLDASIKSTNILFSILLFLSGVRKNAKVLIPKQMQKEASLIFNLDCYAVSSLKEAIEFFKSEDKEQFKVKKDDNLFNNSICINNEIYLKNTEFTLDFKDVKGQENAKYALKLAALGMHNIMLEGSPGCGKSMCAKRLVYIMPPLKLSELLEQNAHKSLNQEEVDIKALRSFRSPHRSSTISSILGGGTKNAKIGELALAHLGVLFFDEFAYFNKQIIESLREPLEDNCINISRVNSKTFYKTKFLFCAALNPCPCGNLFKKDQSCNCMQNMIIKYKSRISKPIYDRIDIYLAMDEVGPDAKSSISSKELAQEILEAFIFQKEIRKQDEYNAKLSDEDIKKFCILDEEAQNVLNKAQNVYNLSARSVNKVLKLARSIADFDKSVKISQTHIKKALSFRFR